MTNKIRFHDFAEDLKNSGPHEWYFLAHEIIRNPDEVSSRFNLEQLEDRVVMQDVGEYMIPYKGYTFCIENDFYEDQSEEFKKRYSELKDRRVAGTIERVKDVRVIDSKNIDVIWERYLIREK